MNGSFPRSPGRPAPALGRTAPLLLLGAILSLVATGPAARAKTSSTRSAVVLDRIDRRSNFVYSVSFSKDGKWLAASSSMGVRVWDSATWKEVVTFKHSSGVGCVAFSPDSKTLAVSGTGEPSRLYDTATWKVRCELRLISPATRWLAYSPDGKTLAAVESSGWVRFWDPEAGKERSRFLWPDLNLHKVAYTPDGRTLAGAGRGMALYDLKSKKYRM